MDVLVTCKNKEDPNKNEDARVATTRNSNSSEMLWLSLLFPRMKKIQSNMKSLEWPQHFPHYNSMGAICCHGNQSSDPTWPKT